MKLSTFLLLFTLINISAETFSQKFSFEVKEATIKDLLAKIEGNSDYKFLYRSDLIDVNKQITININDENVESILGRIFDPGNFVYKIFDDNLIVISKKIASQQQSVTGKVTDSSTGEALAGVNVTIEGTLKGTITDANGSFILQRPETGATISFSFIGYVTQKITYNNEDVIDIKLTQDVQALEEVIVVGYGTQKKVNLTGSVANVDFESISNRPSTNSVSALAGSIPGLTIIQQSGQPGNDLASINIRGIGSINAGVAPLIIIDGVTSEVSDFANLSPYEVKEISVLKDAASSAIYGSRAANGVILVTTKNGLESDTKINFNAYWGLQEATVLPKLVDSWDFAELQNEARTNAGLSPFFTDEQIELMKNNDPTDGFSNTNWANEILRVSPIQNYNISISTGNEKLSVYTGLNYYNQEGILLNSNSDRYNLRSKFELKLNEHIKLGLNLSGVSKKSHQSAVSLGGADYSIMGTVYGTPNAVPVYYNNGNYFVMFNDVPGYQRIYNPIMQAEFGYNNGANKGFVSTFTVEINWKKLKFNSLISYNYNDALTKNWEPRLISINDAGETVWDTNYAILTQQFSNTHILQVENYLSYSTKFVDNHAFSILAGHTFLDNKYSYFQAYGENFPSNSLQVLDASSADSQRAYGQDSYYSLQSLFGRINYDYKSKYLFEINIRYDGSSRFAKDNRYGVFPSFSAGWRVSEEKFLEGISILNNLKIRASWGVLGNQDIGDNYAYTSVYSTLTSYLINGQYTSGASITDMANDKICWESTNSLNLGLDLALLNKLEFTFDYFIRNTENMLITLPIPITLGDLNPPYQNIGKIQNKGWELSGIYRDNADKLIYSLNFSLSQVKNKAIDLNNQEWYPTNQIIKEGESLYSWYGYLTDGIFQNQEEIDASAKQTPAALSGDIKYKDISGIDGVPDGKIDSYDRTIIGKSFPEFSYGFGGSLNYRNFDFNIFFQGISQVDINDFSRINQTGVGGNPKNWSVEWLNRWTSENPSDKYPRLDFNRTVNQLFSDYWLKNGSYLRLKNMEVGYSFARNILNRISVDNMRLYFGGQNLLTFTKVKHFDPERSMSQVRSEFYPQLRIYQIGLNMTF